MLRVPKVEMEKTDECVSDEKNLAYDGGIPAEQLLGEDVDEEVESVLRVKKEVEEEPEHVDAIGQEDENKPSGSLLPMHFPVRYITRKSTSAPTSSMVPIHRQIHQTTSINISSIPEPFSIAYPTTTFTSTSTSSASLLPQGSQPMRFPVRYITRKSSSAPTSSMVPIHQTTSTNISSTNIDTRKRFWDALEDSEVKKRRTFADEGPTTSARSTSTHLYECNQCSAAFTSEKWLLIHNEQKRCVKKVPRCAKTIYTVKDDILSQMDSNITVSRTAKPLHAFVCDICGKSYTYKGNLDIHKEHHKNGFPKCFYCGEIFFSVTGLMNHMRIHKKQQ